MRPHTGDWWRMRAATCFAIYCIALALPILAQTNGVDYEQIGDSLYAQFENTDALDAYERSAAEREPSYGVLIKLARTANDVAQDAEADGDIAGAEKMYQKAVDYAERVADRYPDRAASWFMLAATTGKLAQFRGGKEKVEIGRAVEEYYHRSIELDSTYALAYLVGGIFNRELSQLNWLQRLAASALYGGVPSGSLNQSKALLRKAIRLQPDLLIAHWELAQTCFAMDRPDEAMAHIRYIEKLRPQNTEEMRLKAKAADLLRRQG